MLQKYPIWVETEASDQFPSRDKSFVKTAKNYTRADVNVFQSCPIYLTSLLCPLCFFRYCIFEK